VCPVCCYIFHDVPDLTMSTSICFLSSVNNSIQPTDRAKRPVWARESCRINPPRFMVECRKRRLNQASFVLLCFMLFAFSGLCSVCVASVFDLSSVTYFPV